MIDVIPSGLPWILGAVLVIDAGSNHHKQHISVSSSIEQLRFQPSFSHNQTMSKTTPFGSSGVNDSALSHLIA